MYRVSALTLYLSLTVLSAPARAQTADTAFQQSVRLDVAEASAFAFAMFDVPPGKRLLIQYLAISAEVPSGQRFTSSVQTTVRGVAAEYAQIYTSQPNGDGTDSVVSNQALPVKADGGTTIYFQVFRRIPKGAVRVTFVMSGDLVAMP